MILMNALAVDGAGIKKSWSDIQTVETRITRDAPSAGQERMMMMNIKLSDDMQRAINAEHNARTIGSAKVTEKIITGHDYVMSQALTGRQTL